METNDTLQEMGQRSKDNDRYGSNHAIAIKRLRCRETLLENPRIRTENWNPFQEFPALVWDMIVDKMDMKSPKDRWNLLEAFPQLGGIIKKQEVILYKVLPLIFMDMKKADVLKCRAVSKWWRKTVDRFIEDHPSRLPFNPQTFSKVVVDKCYRTLKSKGMQSVFIGGPTGFLHRARFGQEQQKDGSALIPTIVGQSVTFGFDQGIIENFWSFQEVERQQIRRYYVNLEEFLAKFGPNILHANIPLISSLVFGGADYILCWLGFQSCLQKLVSLKSLLIVNEDLPTTAGSIQWRAFMTELDMNMWVATTFAVFPLPDLPNLDTLILAESPDRVTYVPNSLNAIFYQFICKFGNQLRKLKINLEMLKWITENGQLVAFPNLVEINVECTSLYNKNAFKNLMKELQSPRLEKLEIDQHTAEINLPDVLECVHERKLKVLVIKARVTSDWLTNSMSLSYDLRTVSTLTIFMMQLDGQYYRSLDNLNFLSFMPMLEYLRITVSLKKGETLEPQSTAWTTRTVKKCLKEMEIWKILPKLQILVVGEKHYAKDIYG